MKENFMILTYSLIPDREFWKRANVISHLDSICLVKSILFVTHIFKSSVKVSRFICTLFRPSMVLSLSVEVALL